MGIRTALTDSTDQDQANMHWDWLVLLLKVVFVLTAKKTLAYQEIWNGNEYETLEGEACLRKCSVKEEAKICEFNFEVSWWHTMTQDCLECPKKIEDCFNKNCITADGNSRLMQLVNKQLPGPSILVCERDIVRVKVTNKLMQGAGLSIHWHGIEQWATPENDGVPYITQYYIDIGKTFVYEFVAMPAGTHYWHAHSGMEMGDGVGGPLIVRRPIELEENSHLYDEDLPDHFIYFQSLRPNIEIIAFTEFVTNFDESFADPVSILINGKTQRIAYGEEGYLTPMTTYSVTQGKRYRFRLIFAGPAGCQPIFYIDHHQMLVIDTQVGSIEPITVDAIAMTPGHRVDFVIDANQAIGEYYITIDGLQACGGSGGIAELTRAILRYDGADPNGLPLEPINIIEEAKKSVGEKVMLNSFSDLRSDGFNAISTSKLNATANTEESIKGIPDETIYLRKRTFLIEDVETEIFLKKFDGNPARSLLNHIAFKQPPKPLMQMSSDELREYTCNAESLEKAGINCSLVYCECIHSYQIKLGSLVEIHLLSTYDDKLIHPMHLHGNSFYVVSEGVFEKETSIEEYKAMDEAGLVPRNFIKVAKVDTVTPHREGYAVIRFRAENPGWWIFHCHLEFHIEWGMSVVLVVEE